METQNRTPKVSVVIPVYNGADFLGEAIDSALSQTYPNVEILVINDGSKDDNETEKIALAYGKKVRYFYKENGGVASALNYGIRKMEGSYFSWLSHDDLYEPTKIEEEVALINALQNERAIIISNTKVLFKSGIKKKTYIDKNVFKNFELFLALDAEVGINGCTLLIPKQALIESGGFDTHLPVTQDYDLWYRLNSKYKYDFYLLERNLAIYRRHDKQDSVQKQQLCIDAGDDLRATILVKVGRNEFDAYLKCSPNNLMYAFKNYKLYKDRRHIKSASLILDGLLRYFYKHDRKQFYRSYISEIDTELTQHIKSDSLTMNGELKQSIEDEYRKLTKSWPVSMPLKISATKISVPPKNQVLRSIWVLYQSLRRDGTYLTAEKAVRAIIKKSNS